MLFIDIVCVGGNPLSITSMSNVQNTVTGAGLYISSAPKRRLLLIIYQHCHTVVEAFT